MKICRVNIKWHQRHIQNIAIGWDFGAMLPDSLFWCEVCGPVCLPTPSPMTSKGFGWGGTEKLNHCFLYLILSSNIKYLVEIIRNKRIYALQKATVGKFYSWNVFFLFCRFVQNLHAIVIKRGLLHRMSSVHLLLSLAEQIGCFFSE